jgi:signal transduction histidine kinase
LRRQRVIGFLLIALGAMPVLLLSPESPTPSGAGEGVRGLDLVVSVIQVAAWIWLYLPPALLAALFPDGRLPCRRWRWLLVGWGVFIVGFHMAVLLDPANYGNGDDQIHGNPPFEPAHWATATMGVALLGLLLALLLGSVASVAVRYRHGTTLVRRQIKWFALSALLLPLVLVATWVAYLLTSVAETVVVIGLLAVFVSIPISVAVAILRHDLYDIDRIVSRAVTYTVVSGLLAGLFAVSTVAVGVVVGNGSDLTIALSTLVCAIAFGPVHRRIQRIVDARFDRDHRDALLEISKFVDEVRDGVAEPEQIEDVLRRALHDPELQVLYAVSTDSNTLWRDGTGRPVEPRRDGSLEIAVGGRLLGAVNFGASADRPQLLREILREAHLPLEVARSRIELRHALAETEASRTRLVQAGYAERRALERDLHDGAQQSLVAIGMHLRRAQQRVSMADPMYDVLGRAVGELQAAVAELRRLANGVRPSGLDEGLPAAIRALVRSSPIPVELQITRDVLPDALATTAFYVAAEALTNALKHASATTLRIEVTRIDGVVVVLVADDGRGGAEVLPGSGLAGLRDRVHATGGSLDVRSDGRNGTQVEARLPCGS